MKSKALGKVQVGNIVVGKWFFAELLHVSKCRQTRKLFVRNISSHALFVAVLHMLNQEMHVFSAGNMWPN